MKCLESSFCFVSRRVMDELVSMLTVWCNRPAFKVILDSEHRAGYRWQNRRTMQF